MEQTASFPNGALATLAQQGALLRRNLREPIPIESRRIALERMVTLDVPHLGFYLAEYSANISMTGMFIQSGRIQPPGTVMAFELSLTDGRSPISGEAEVVWVRARARSADLPAGMGLRFVGLDEDSRGQIRRAVEKRPPKADETIAGDELGRRGSSPTPAEDSVPRVGIDPIAEGHLVEPGTAEPTAALSGAALSEAADLIGSRRRSRAVAVSESGRKRWRWVPHAALAGLFVGAVLYLSQGRPWDPMNAPREPEARPAPPAVAESVPIQAPSEAVFDMVASWAGAWSAQRTDAYLSFYAQTYRPPDDLSLAHWRELRRDRISRPRRIEVEITDLEVTIPGRARARASFLQSYASDDYRDSVRKILELVLEDGQWKIQVERTEE